MIKKNFCQFVLFHLIFHCERAKKRSVLDELSDSMFLHILLNIQEIKILSQKRIGNLKITFLKHSKLSTHLRILVRSQKAYFSLYIILKKINSCSL